MLAIIPLYVTALGLLTGNVPPTIPQPGDKLVVTMDTTKAPDLATWGEDARKLAEEWHPKVSRILATKNFKVPTTVHLIIEPMDGVAYADGATIHFSAAYIRTHKNDIGMIVHELTHVIQSYPKYDPSWLVEGIADYVRLFKYEPKNPRPKINPDRAKYTDAYKTTAAFLDWIERKQHKGFVRECNDQLRAGTFTMDLFKKLTGKDVDQLWQGFTDEIRANRI